MGEGKFTPLTTPTPLNRQSPNIAYVITSTISPHKPHLVKIAPGVTSPYIAKVTTQFRAKGEVLVLLCFLFFVRSTISRQPAGRFTLKFACWRTLVPDVSSPLLGLPSPGGGAKKGAMKFSLLWESMGNFCILLLFERYLSNVCTDPHLILFV